MQRREVGPPTYEVDPITLLKLLGCLMRTFKDGHYLKFKDIVATLITETFKKIKLRITSSTAKFLMVPTCWFFEGPVLLMQIICR